MAAVPNIQFFNDSRKELMKIRNLNDETILFTKDEAREALVKYIAEELDLFADDLGRNAKTELEETIKVRFKMFETAMVNHIEKKFNTITQQVIEKITSREVDNEINRRVEERLKKIKDSL